MQAELYDNPCKIFQQLKKRKTIYGRLLTKNVADIKPWDTVHVDLIVPYINAIIQHHQDGATINIYASLTCMTMIDPTAGWFEIVKFPMFDLDEVTGGND